MRFLFARCVQKAREQVGMIADSDGDGLIDEGADGLNESFALCHAEQAQNAGYFKSRRQCRPSALSLVDTDPPDHELKGELNHGGLALVEGRHGERGERA